MRSSKNRQRSKQNRPRTLGNIINRVFDSSGPEGKVRGTPQQIIEKYQLLARDAQLSNDRVAAENFMQHAEHYTRMLAEAQREMAAEQESRRQQQGQGNGQGQGGQPGWRDRNGQPTGRDDRPEAEETAGGFDVVEPEDDGSLIDLPDFRAEAPRDQNRDQNRDRSRDPRPPRDQRPPREDRAPREDRPARDERPPREDRPVREDRAPREDRPVREDRPPREDRRPAFLRPPREDTPPKAEIAV
jgi:hypothetical protein